MSDTDEPKKDDDTSPEVVEDKKDSPAKDEPKKDHEAEAAKWKALARKHEAQAKANADAAKKLAEIEDADKSESEKANKKATEAEQRATDAEAKLHRLEVALDKAPEGMPLSQVRKLSTRLAGSTREELEADAVELFTEFAPPDKGDDDKDGEKDGSKRRPRERLRPGAVADAEPETNDPAKLAESVPRGW